MQTSSSRREATPEYRHKAPVGCISGILRLLSRRHSRKRLTSASKKEKITATPLAKPQPEPVKKEEKKGSEDTLTLEKKTLAMLAIGEPRRRSCETPRSPTIQPEIRRSSADSPRRSSALVARLMGLDDAPASPESSAEKRRKLLGALERCDEDLKALKRIIETVQLAELRKKQIRTVGSVDEELGRVQDRCRLDGGDLTVKAGSKDINGEQPSPVSVLDVITSPRFRANKSEKSIGSRTPEASPLGVVSQSGDSERVAVVNQRDKSFEQNGMRIKRKEGPLQRRSKAMAENVREVWEDGVWEERWELGRIGVGLEIDIFGDLVEELVKEMVGCYNKLLSFPLRNCRKRLCF